MDIIEQLFKFLKYKDKNLLISVNNPISNSELNIVVIKVLSWLKLEYKRSIWISEGKKSTYKPLELDRQYPWCANLYELVEQEKLFHEMFEIRDGKFDFLEEISEEDKTIIREKAYQNYNPQKHT